MLPHTHTSFFHLPEHNNNITTSYSATSASNVASPPSGFPLPQSDKLSRFITWRYWVSHISGQRRVYLHLALRLAQVWIPRDLKFSWQLGFFRKFQLFQAEGGWGVILIIVILPRRPCYWLITKQHQRFLYSPPDRQKRFTLQAIADLFIPTSTRLLGEAFGYAANRVRRLLTHIFPPLSIARYY